MFNKEQRQIIFGTLLGKSYITQIKRSNYFLTIPESKDLNWLSYKVLIIEESKKNLIKDGKRFIWRSKCSPMWNKIRQEFYDNNGKTIKMSILDQLCDDGLSTWFLDRGEFIGKRVCLGTTAFGYDNNLIIARYFNEVGIPCDIKKERNTAKILFTKEGTKVFLNTIVNAVPECMFYRLP